MFQGLEHKFQALVRKIVWGGKSFSPKGRKKYPLGIENLPRLAHKRQLCIKRRIVYNTKEKTVLFFDPSEKKRNFVPHYINLYEENMYFLACGTRMWYC